MRLSTQSCRKADVIEIMIKLMKQFTLIATDSRYCHNWYAVLHSSIYYLLITNKKGSALVWRSKPHTPAASTELASQIKDGVQPRPQPRPHTRTRDIVVMDALRSPMLWYKGSHTVIFVGPNYMDYYSHLPTSKG